MSDVTKDLIAAIEAAFREGFRSPTTYNDTVLNSEDEEWEKSDAKAAIARAEAALAEPVAATQPNASHTMARDDVIRLAREAGAGVALYMSSPPRISDALFRGKALETFAHLVIANFLARTGQYVTNDASREAAITEAVAPWKDAVIEQLVVAHIFTAEHENDPRKAIQDLLAYHADIAVDPRVSEAAARLVEQARAEEREAWPDLTCVIQWLEAGCDPKDAAKELRILQGKICAGRES